MASRKLRRSLAPVLFPLSLLYGTVTGIRNILFDLKILKSVGFDLPVISVGNLTAGGTGKTPHVEYLLKLLSEKFSVGLLSRGYKRKTKGFQLAGKNSLPQDIGDESYQVLKKFKTISVAVDENRVHGIVQMKKKIKNLGALILDDAFQHRYVKAGISILLIDYYRPVFKDYLLPMGDLRETKSALSRADIVIVTKVPENMAPIEKRLWIKELDLFPYQLLFFTGFTYGNLVPVFDKVKKNTSLGEVKKDASSILLLTGIANPEPMKKTLQEYTGNLVTLSFPDHHEYTQSDLDTVQKKYTKPDHGKNIIITTEKDAVKLKQLKKVDPVLKENMFYLPVEVKFLDNGQKEFDKKIIEYVAKNKGISRLH
jgi:tetraacyldisaccharide 4'-kinase